MSAYRRDVISLKSYAPTQSLPAFLGIRCYGEPSHEFLTLLTPNVMQWDDDLWLFDLSLCLRFWQAQAAKLGKHPLSLCEELLAASGQSYRAVFAPHPWQAVFLLSRREEQQAATVPEAGLPVLQELTSLSGPFGQALFSTADWQAWFQALKPLARHFAALKRPRFVLSRFQSQCAQMQRLMQRLGSQGPEALKAASQEAIKRRFGTILAEVWQWTFAPTPPPLTSPRTLPPVASLWGQEEDGLAHATGLPAGFATFPWRAWQPPQNISVQRHLEAALSHWQECAGYLQEDLERLCQNIGWNVAAERITSLEWELTFYHLKTLKVAINFRHPHSLQTERGQQQTALTQAEFAFEAARQELAGRSEDLDLPADIPLIGWRLTLAGRMTMPSWLAPLFAALGEEEEGAEPSERLLALENKLPLPLDRYYLCPNFNPLAAFSLDPAAAAPLAAANLGLWKVAARRRPLFIYDQPHLLPTQAYSSRRQFLERTPCPWWQSPLARQQLARDYYLLIDHSHKAHWVFYDKRGHWYKHGIFS